jgi:hypothetical protein
MKRKGEYHVNILVIKHPNQPEDEGQVFKYKFGIKIFDKIKGCMQKEDELDDKPKFNPFDLWEGANFRLRISQVSGGVQNGKEVKFPNYDKSEFDSPKPLFTNKDGEPEDDKMEEVWNREYSLTELIAPSQFKTYEELQKRLNLVLDRVEDTDADDLSWLNELD